MGISFSMASSSNPRSQLRPRGCSELELTKCLQMVKSQLLMLGRSQAGSAVINQREIAQLVEAIRQSTECFVWGEHHDASLFDLFCEHKMLVVYISALCAPS